MVMLEYGIASTSFRSAASSASGVLLRLTPDFYLHYSLAGGCLVAHLVEKS